MSDPIEIALEQVGKWASRSHVLAHAIYGLIEGADPEEAADLLFHYGYTDCDGFWIGDEE